MGKGLQRFQGMVGSPQEKSTLLLNVQVGHYHELNEVASRIWELLAQPIDEYEIVATLLAQYDVTPEDCQDQVTAFLQELKERGMLEVV
jgi:hypothetical protein